MYGPHVRTEVRSLAYVVVILGFASCLYAGVSGRNEGPFVQASGAIVVAGLALLGVAAGIASWRDERERARKQQQEEAYATLVLQLLARFTSVVADPQDEARIRAKVAVWAEMPVIRALNEWNEVYDRHVSNVSAGQFFELSDVGSAEFEEATASVAQAVRKELNPGDTVTVDELKRTLFNKPS